MTTLNKKLKDDGDIDRISSLPINVIDLIMKLLPVRDAAKTCVLSSNWRYVWADHPNVILDKKFWDDITRPNIDFNGIVTRILLRHTGNIQNFAVDISVINPQQHRDVDLWLSVLCTKGVKVLSIKNSAEKTYTIHSCVFYASELTNLSISNCIIKTKETLTGFNKLRHLALSNLTLNSWILKTPLLTKLSLVNCTGVRGFCISAPKLATLTLKANDVFNFTPYILCSKITYAYISFNKNIQDLGTIPCVNILQLFSFWPKLSKLSLDGLSLKYLTTGILLNNFSNKLKLTRFKPFSIDLDQTPWILCIMGNSPFLKTFDIKLLGEISTSKELNNSEALKYLEEPSVMNMGIDLLHTVKIRYFKGSRTELQFVKILLHCSPSLKLMLVEENEQLTTCERLKILKILMQYQHAYAKPEIIFGSYF